MKDQYTGRFWRYCIAKCWSRVWFLILLVSGLVVVTGAWQALWLAPFFFGLDLAVLASFVQLGRMRERAYFDRLKREQSSQPPRY